MKIIVGIFLAIDFSWIKWKYLKLFELQLSVPEKKTKIKKSWSEQVGLPHLREHFFYSQDL